MLQESGCALQDLISKRSIVVIHFWAKWNGYDPVVGERLEALANEFGSRILFVACDIDNEDNFQICRDAGIMSVPAVAVFVKGKQTMRRIGVLPMSTYREMFSSL